MRTSTLLAGLGFVCALLADPHAASTLRANVPQEPIGELAPEEKEPPELLEVENLARVDGPKFNKRPYAISINRDLPDARQGRKHLALRLKEGHHLDNYVFEWFGKGKAERLNLLIGSQVPIEDAQAAIAVFARWSRLPVYIGWMTADEDFGNTHRIYVGGLANFGKEPMSAEKVNGLLKRGLTAADFAQLLPPYPSDNK
jgi:hypothetical protein